MKMWSVEEVKESLKYAYKTAAVEQCEDNANNDSPSSKAMGQNETHTNIEICILVEQKGWKKVGKYMCMCESHYYHVYHLMANFMQRLCSFSPTVSNPAAPKSSVLRFHSHRLTDFMILWLDGMKYMPSGECRLNGINGNALSIRWPDLS